jgi:hypothetical protein
MFSMFSRRKVSFYAGKTSEPTQKELVAAVESYLNPLLILLKYSPIGITKSDIKHITSTKLLILLLRLISFLFFLITCVIFILATCNAQKYLSSEMQLGRVVQIMTLLFASIAFGHFINLICATLWFWNNGLHTFCTVLSQVCEHCV